MNRHERRATVAAGKWMPLQRAQPKPLTEREIEERIDVCLKTDPTATRDAARQLLRDARHAEMWMNDCLCRHRAALSGFRCTPAVRAPLLSAENAISAAEGENNIHAFERLALCANGFHDAINAVLHGAPTLYNEFIELPRLMAIRRFCRQYSF